MHTCIYCGIESEDTIQMTGYSSYVCKEGCGCQSETEVSWIRYFSGALVYDVPFLLFGTIVIMGFNLILHDPLLTIIPDHTWIIEGMFDFGIVIFTLSMMLTTGLPIIFALFCLTALSFYIMFN